MSGKFGLIAALALLVLGAFVWSRILSPKSHPSEASLREVDGMEIRVEAPETSTEGARVAVQLENKTQRTALSVVFTVEVVDAEEQVLAVNPLGNALNMPPGESRTLEVPFPGSALQEATSDVTARGRVDLVRWQE